MSMLSRAMWQTQEVLHGKNTAALPLALLGVSSFVLFYRHMSEESHEYDSIKTFLALIVIQMLPVVLLEMKILACADPVGLLCKFGSHVILMHAAFLGLRAGRIFFSEYGAVTKNTSFLLLALVTLWKGFNFRLSFRSMLQHYDVIALSCLALMVAYCQEFASELVRPESWLHEDLLARTIATGSDYIEILAFVPAVWMVYKEDKNVVPRVTVESAETKKLAIAFFAFLALFYTWEDVVDGAYSVLDVVPLAAVAHVMHYLLLLDFSFFILAHIFNPEKLLNIKALFCDTFYNGV